MPWKCFAFRLDPKSNPKTRIRREFLVETEKFYDVIYLTASDCITRRELPMVESVHKKKPNTTNSYIKLKWLISLKKKEKGNQQNLVLHAKFITKFHHLTASHPNTVE